MQQTEKKKRRSKNENVTIRIPTHIPRNAAWSGYGESYIQNIVKGTMKALKLLSIITFDPGLLFWTSGLKHHLETKIKEAGKEKLEVEKYKF